jgi:hypothetical protein
MGMVGKKVFGIDGPGQSPREGLCGQVGTIVSEDVIEWADQVDEVYWVEWEDGHREPFTKHTVKPASQACGIGVYYQD